MNNETPLLRTIKNGRGNGLDILIYLDEPNRPYPITENGSKNLSLYLILFNLNSI